MTKAEINKFKQVLEAKHAELASVLRKRDEIAIERASDAIDEVTRAAERELAIRNLDRESNLLRNVRSALRRIKDGTYGICAHCEEDISTKRLNAVPWTPYCISCQELADRQDRDRESILPELQERDGQQPPMSFRANAATA